VPLFDVTSVALERALAGAAQRQAILANNIANANTPGFRRSDLDFHTALAEALERGASAAELRNLPLQPQMDESGAVRVDGSNVNVEREMASLAENSLEYQSIVAVMRARVHMLEQAITGRV